MSNETISVIVTRCIKNERGEYRVYGYNLCDGSQSTFSRLKDAFLSGETKIAKELSVIVRPNYNEKDEKGIYFREWRSFDGEAFKEVRWYVNTNSS